MFLRPLGLRLVLLSMFFSLSGCFLTKIVTVPMRIGGAIVSVVPVVGQGVGDAIDEVADTIDTIPI